MSLGKYRARKYQRSFFLTRPIQQSSLNASITPHTRRYFTPFIIRDLENERLSQRFNKSRLAIESMISQNAYSFVTNYSLVRKICFKTRGEGKHLAERLISMKWEGSSTLWFRSLLGCGKFQCIGSHVSSFFSELLTYQGTKS